MSNNDFFIPNTLPQSAKEAFSKLAISSSDITLKKVLENDTIENDVLKVIPFINLLVNVIKVSSAIKNAHFIKKYDSFIGIIHENKIDEELLFNVLKDKNKVNKIVEQTIIEIDRYQTIEKSKMLGRLFVKTFKDKIFTFDEYNTLLFGIEAIHPYLGVETLRKYYEIGEYIEAEENINSEQIEKSKTLDYTTLSGTGLITTPKVISYYGGKTDFVVFISKLGIKFYENIVTPIE